jgi:hypothetical protein
MTNWEWITSDKDRLVEILNIGEDFWENVASPWWCNTACPDRINGKCIHEGCPDKYTCEYQIRMWLDAEHKD